MLYHVYLYNSLHKFFTQILGTHWNTQLLDSNKSLSSWHHLHVASLPRLGAWTFVVASWCPMCPFAKGWRHGISRICSCRMPLPLHILHSLLPKRMPSSSRKNAFHRSKQICQILSWASCLRLGRMVWLPIGRIGLVSVGVVDWDGFSFSCSCILFALSSYYAHQDKCEKKKNRTMTYGVYNSLTIWNTWDVTSALVSCQVASGRQHTDHLSMVAALSCRISD